MKKDIFTIFLENRFKDTEKIKKVLAGIAIAMLVILIAYGVGIIPTPGLAIVRAAMLLPVVIFGVAVKYFFIFHKKV